MDAYHHQRRFAGSGDAPPQPQPPPPSHQNSHWYPSGPAPPYLPHPNRPFPPQHHQWGHPPPDLQHQHHPQPPPQPPYAYQHPPPPMQMQQPPPPAPANPWPPHHAAAQPPPPRYPPPPPPPGQAWTNHSWAQNHGYAGHANDEDWATKAKAWAAAKSTTQNHQIQQHVLPTSRTEVHHYGYHDQYQQPPGLPTEPLHPPIPQSSKDQLSFQMTGQQRETNYLPDRGPMAPPANNFGSFPSTYEQEVSYNYSSASGNGNTMLQYPSSQAQTSPTASSVQDGFPRTSACMPGRDRQSFKTMVDPSDQPLEFDSRKAPDIAVHQTMNISSTVPIAVSEHATVATSNQSWIPSATVGFFPRAPLPPQAAQVDPSMHAAPLFGVVSGSHYVAPAGFGVGSVTDAFPTDANTPFSVTERSKKPPVPNWLREELLKKKSTAVSASAQHSTNFDALDSEDAENPLKRADADSRSVDSAKSTEDDEDEIETTRMAAINQETKRVLTEILLKVTDDLFDEIATKVLNEDDSPAESNTSTSTSRSKEPYLGESKAKAMPKAVIPAKPTNIGSTDRSDDTGLLSPKGALLGLANYDSDDEDEDDGDGGDKIPVSNLSSEIKAGVAHPEDGNESIDGERYRDRNERSSSIQSSSSGEDHKYNKGRSQRSANAECEQELRIHDTQNGEFPLDAKTSIQPKGVDHAINEAHRCEGKDIRNGKDSSGNHNEKYNDMENTHRHLEKSNNNEDIVKDVNAGHRKVLESSTAEKYNDDDKYSMHGNVDKKSSFKEERGSGRSAKYGSDTRDDAKGDRKGLAKDAREKRRDIADRREEKGKDEKEDRRQIPKSSANHRRSRSPSGRSQTRKESSSHFRASVANDEPSDGVKKRKHHSRKNSISPSPPKSRDRRVSRSPHSKHSHRRHSPCSSGRRKERSRSRTPVKRR